MFTGDGDRNMILGTSFFVTPSDSVVVIAANAKELIMYFKNSFKGLARSMPTSGTLDRVAEKFNLSFFEFTNICLTIFMGKTKVQMALFCAISVSYASLILLAAF
ncbi:unnamed protein product [Vicia faba]|uniref:Uncharacterized protein n=1 Tax=Vicia faba TaxID=3906 RepID=A0AAV1B8D2_VICFA|nr:unnamed protein product [Vicia faba]